MKKILLSAVILSASVVAYSQDQKTTEPQPQPQTQVIKETDQKSYEAKQAEWDNLLKAELKLTEEQVTKIAVIKKEFTDKKVPKLWRNQGCVAIWREGESILARPRLTLWKRKKNLSGSKEFRNCGKR